MEKVKVDARNAKFLEEYGPVIAHHIDCILRSRMLLDDDMQLLTTFCSPDTFATKPGLKAVMLASAVCAGMGLIVSKNRNSLYPLAASLVPAALHACSKARLYYYHRKYKRDFERFVRLMNELYKLNRSIIEYYHKKNSALGKLTNASLVTLVSSTQTDFLKTAISILKEALQKMLDATVEISVLVPIPEMGNFLQWSVKDLDCGLVELVQFETLTDLYVLVISNFLRCIGLSTCTGLWMDNRSDFQRVVTVVLPETGRFFERAVDEIRTQFDRVRFTLCDDDRINKNDKRTDGSVYRELERPLADFLVNLQTTFETSKCLQSMLEDGAEPGDLIGAVYDQVVLCDESFDCLLRLFRLMTRRAVAEAAIALPQASVALDAVSERKPTEIRWDEPLEEVLGDEEYNLSVHGSDTNDSVELICEYADQCSTEHLALMLHELKKKLQDRKQKGTDAEPEEAPVEPAPPKELAPPPLPLPPPSILRLPPLDGSTNEDFLKSLRSVALKLNREEEFQFGFNMFPDLPRAFNTTYRCFSVAMLPGNERQDVERGGKIIMPPSALEQLTRLNINYPMLFKIVNKKTSRTTHCGVLEFVADEGKVYLPLWMMHNLVLEEGDLIQIESISLPVGTFAKFQPLSPDFLDITNPKAVLENCLRTFACLTSGDVIAVKYNQRVYELCVLETQPGNAISIIECDMNVEFAPPVGYREVEKVKQPEEEMAVDPADLMPEPSGFVAFRGAGNRLDGKRRKDSGPSESSPLKPVYVRGIPDYDYEIGTLRFLRHVTKSPMTSKEENEEFRAFSGEGFSLKRRN